MRVGGLRARLVWQNAARGAFAAPAVERRVLCVAGQRGGGVGAHAWRINTCRWTSGFFHREQIYPLTYVSHMRCSLYQHRARVAATHGRSKTHRTHGTRRGDVPGARCPGAT